MIRVTVELIPSNGMKARELARMEIANISEPYAHDMQEADYSVSVVTDQGEDISARQRVVRNFPRLQLNVWALILSVLSTFRDEDFELVHKQIGGGSERD